MRCLLECLELFLGREVGVQRQDQDVLLKKAKFVNEKLIDFFNLFLAGQEDKYVACCVVSTLK